MKKITTLALLLLFSGSLFAQHTIAEKALRHANEMTRYYNSKDFIKYVDYLAPASYGNDPANKVTFAGIWKEMLSTDTSEIKILKVAKSENIYGQYQVLLHSYFRNSQGYVFGISNDKGESWQFTSHHSTRVQFEQVREVFPTIDTSFARLVDSRFGTRVSYEVGKTVAPFTLTDIYGNTISSESLKGKVIVLNFWGITCGPCIKEIPELNALVEKMKGKDVVFIALAIATPKEYLLHTFLPKHPFNYQIVLIDSKDYSVTSFPTHILIGKDQIIADRFSGYSPGNLEKLEQIIAGLLEK